MALSTRFSRTDSIFSFKAGALRRRVQVRAEEDKQSFFEANRLAVNHKPCTLYLPLPCVEQGLYGAGLGRTAEHIRSPGDHQSHPLPP